MSSRLDQFLGCADLSFIHRGIFFLSSDDGAVDVCCSGAVLAGLFICMGPAGSVAGVTCPERPNDKMPNYFYIHVLPSVAS